MSRHSVQQVVDDLTDQVRDAIAGVDGVGAELARLRARNADLEAMERRARQLVGTTPRYDAWSRGYRAGALHVLGIDQDAPVVEQRCDGCGAWPHTAHAPECRIAHPVPAQEATR